MTAEERAYRDLMRHLLVARNLAVQLFGPESETAETVTSAIDRAADDYREAPTTDDTDEEDDT